MDWDAFAMAPLARGVWMLAKVEDGERLLAEYARLTGRGPRPASLELCRLAWDHGDVAARHGRLRAPHRLAPDAEKARSGLYLTLDDP